MPLSEHEQRMLDQIESALYAEDPKFASTVRGGRMRAASTRRRFQAAALFVIGLVLLVSGLAIPFRPGGFPVISLVGFIVMFGAGALLLLRSSGSASAPTAESTEDSTVGGASPRPRRGERPNRSAGFASRMEERFKRRFDQQ